MYAITNTAPKTEGRAVPWNKGKLLGQKPPLKLKEIWAVRIRLQLQPLRHDVDSSGRGGHGAQQCPRRGERDWTLSRYNTRRALHRRTRRASGPSPSRDEDDDGHAARALLTEVTALTFTGRPEQAIARADAALANSVGHDLTPAQRAELLGLRMDGLEATHRIVKRWPDDKRPCIVAMTASAMQGDREECSAVGMDDYLTTPIRVDALTKALVRRAARSVT